MSLFCESHKLRLPCTPVAQNRNETLTFFTLFPALTTTAENVRVESGRAEQAKRHFGVRETRLQRETPAVRTRVGGGESGERDFDAE